MDKSASGVFAGGVSTNVGGAIFYTGKYMGKENAEWALETKARVGGYLLDDTEAGQFLGGLGVIGGGDTPNPTIFDRALWDVASAKMGDEARGNIIACIAGDRKAFGTWSTWSTQELPAIFANRAILSDGSNTTTINGWPVDALYKASVGGTSIFANKLLEPGAKVCYANETESTSPQFSYSTAAKLAALAAAAFVIANEPETVAAAAILAMREIARRAWNALQAEGAAVPGGQSAYIVEIPADGEGNPRQQLSIRASEGGGLDVTVRSPDENPGEAWKEVVVEINPDNESNVAFRATHVSGVRGSNDELVLSTRVVAEQSITTDDGTNITSFNGDAFAEIPHDFVPGGVPASEPIGSEAAGELKPLSLLIQRPKKAAAADDENAEDDSIEVIAGGAAEVGSILGSQLGSALAGDNQFLRIGASTILSATLRTVGSALDTYVSYETGEITITDAFGAAAGTFGDNVAQAFQGQIVGAVSGFLTGELAESLGLHGFGGGLFRSVTGSLTNAVLNNIATGTLNGQALPDIVAGMFTNVQFTNGLATGIQTGIGSFIGTYLANKIIAPKTQGGAIGSSIGSAIGSALGAGIAANDNTPFPAQSGRAA